MGNEVKQDDPEVAEERDTPDASLSPEVQQRLGRQLQRAYAELVNQPLPDRFTKLLDELAKSDRKPEPSS